MRRQIGAGGPSAGSSCTAQLDPHPLPIRFEARDHRADSGTRQIEIARGQVTLRRSVGGMRMAINIQLSEFAGIALRRIDDRPTLILKHRDPSLSVALAQGEDTASDLAWQHWSELLGLPRLVESQSAEPAPRRRRRNAIKARRPSILMRRKRGSDLSTVSIHRGEREIIAP